MQFFLVPRNGPEQIGMRDIKWFNILGKMHNTIEASRKIKWIDEQKVEREHYTNKNSNQNSNVNNSNSCMIDHILPDLNKEADRKASGKLTKLMHKEFIILFRKRLL